MLRKLLELLVRRRASVVLVLYPFCGTIGVGAVFADGLRSHKVGATSIVAVAGIFTATIGMAALEAFITRRLFSRQPRTRLCTTLSSASDLIPGTRLRKRIKKMIADEAKHAEELEAAGRLAAARWIAFCAWVWAIALVFRAPFAAVLDLVKRSAA